MLTRYFPDFEATRIDVGAASINAVIGGSGPPVLLLHGWPQNLLEWHRVAPQLARDFTVIATDLRGYGQSSKPGGGERHGAYSKRSMAADQIAVMAQLGFKRFAVIGHDRGGRVAHRMALDHAEAIERIAVLDIVPTRTVYGSVNKQLATAYFHWFLLIQPQPMPETLLAGQGAFFLHSLFRGMDEHSMPREILDDYVRCFNDPTTLHAMCEDYRAAATIDLEHDEADLHRRVSCPLFALWGEHGAMHRLYDVLATWKERGENVAGNFVPCGHWMPEESPDAVLEALIPFLRGQSSGKFGS
jgi:haloacetate dehalogenase